ncbi:MAG TPA: ATP synthase F0 subunit B [Thermoanaerobaculia bacterium]|jgi:F-type H+-transporting ATPase subunit b
MIGLPDVTSLYALLAFGISYWILKRFLFSPLSAILEAREQEEREAEAAYAESVKRLERAVAQGEDKLAAARRDSLKTREDLRAQGLSVLEKRLDEARAGATEEIARGSREIEEQAAGAARTLPERAAGLARELAEKVLGRKLAA